MRYLELRRHADSDGDALTEAGRTTAERVGRGMEGPFDGVFTSPAKRAAATAAWFLRGLGQQLPQLHGVTDGLTSGEEGRWRETAILSETGRVDDIEREDPELVGSELPRLADAVLQMLAALRDGQRALAVGHSPFLEAAVYALTDVVLEPLRKCEGVLLGSDGERVTVEAERRLEG
ncbi:MAG TPA: histidine phosphatase family protein [Actinomycetota bacterium]|nr:histidine phosphatase family protein [Actinomycetota bacterium]